MRFFILIGQKAKGKPALLCFHYKPDNTSSLLKISKCLEVAYTGMLVLYPVWLKILLNPLRCSTHELCQASVKNRLNLAD